jgi:hypothetical protein
MIGAPEDGIGSVCKHLDGRGRFRGVADQVPKDVQQGAAQTPRVRLDMDALS